MIRLTDIEFGQCDVEDYIHYINERHSIWTKRFVLNLPKPWTDDPILQRYKFTNVFRQLDKGTIALRKIICQQKDPVLIFFNIVWYRYFNLFTHADELGFVKDYQQLEDFIVDKAKRGKQIFTGAWMTTGVAFEDKHESYLRAAKGAWDKREELCKTIQSLTTLKDTCTYLRELYMVGKFLAYELACDMRFTTLLSDATDKLTWANMGPGAQRGLRRLDFPHKNQKEGCTSMQDLYSMITSKRDPIYIKVEDAIDPQIFNGDWPFELREIEHNLCEFDKYMRVKNGEGRPRSKYPGI